MRITYDSIVEKSQQIEDRLYHWHDRATTQDQRLGKAWYKIAYKIADVARSGTNFTQSESVAIIATLSPQLDWITNLDQAWYTIQSIEHRSRQTGSNRAKAQAIMARSKSPIDIMGGHKVLSFYDNILHYVKSRKVTIDRHMLKVIATQPALKYSQWLAMPYNENDILKYINTEKKYNLISDIFNVASDNIGIKPHQLQAICWIVYRAFVGIDDRPDQSETIASALWFDLARLAKAGEFQDL